MLGKNLTEFHTKFTDLEAKFKEINHAEKLEILKNVFIFFVHLN